MITARGQSKDGKPALVLGFTEENIERLKAGQPVRVPREAMDATGFSDIEVCIVYGETQADVMAQLTTGKPAE